MQTLAIVSLVFSAVALSHGATVYNVMQYGARGDGSHYDNQAFIQTWKLTCEDKGIRGTPIFLAPTGKKFLLAPTVFGGPCRFKRVRVQIDGTLTAPTSKNGWVHCTSDTWLGFQYVENLFVNGSGTINGQGQLWWRGSPMQGDRSCANRPTALSFSKCHGLVLNGLHHINSPQMHISIFGCQRATLSNFHISAPENSPNTDGIDIASSRYINIHDASIRTGDDCIAINGNTFYANITRVTCGPGHGISIGSLGERRQHSSVQHVYVRSCTLSGTMFGARIKTCQGGSGNVNNVVFEDIILNKVGHPIIIDQFYNSSVNSLPRKLETQASTQDPIRASISSNLKINGVTYSWFRGTSSTTEAITLKCDRQGCSKIIMKNINIKSANGKALTSSCSNASGKAKLVTPRVKCLSQQ